MSSHVSNVSGSSQFPIIDGIIYKPGITQDFIRGMRDLPVQKDDVFIVTYPKSGTTWLSEITYQIMNQGMVDYRPIAERVLFIDTVIVEMNVKTREKVNKLYLDHSPRIFSTHCHYDQLPKSKIKAPFNKYIYVARNPKDVAVSFYHFYRSMKVEQFKHKSWDDFFEMFVAGRVRHGDWFEHVLGWSPHLNDSDVLFLKYENMKKDLPGSINQIAKFLGKDLSLEMIHRIADQTTFSAMSDNKGRYYDGESWRHPDFKFIRKGEVGDWKNYFTEEQNRRFDELYEKRMAEIAIKFEF